MRGTSFETPVRLLVVSTVGMLAVMLFVVMVPASNAAPKARTVVVTFNANGGKVGAKKKVTRRVVKGKPVGKLPGAKRASYTFQGWFTRKAGGTKVKGSTRVRKKTTFYARWKRVLTAKEKKLIGAWSSGPDTPFKNSYRTIALRADGTFNRRDDAVSPNFLYLERAQGLWRVSGDRIIATEIVESVKWFENNVPKGSRNGRVANQSWPYFFDDRRSDGAWAEEGFNWLHITHSASKGVYDYVKPTLAG